MWVRQEEKWKPPIFKKLTGQGNVEKIPTTVFLLKREDGVVREAVPSAVVGTPWLLGASPPKQRKLMLPLSISVRAG